jgi:23S rRNA pseudouridine1911/1915/1917 synthase
MSGTTLDLVLPHSLAGERLDAALARAAPQLSRARVQRLLAAGHVTVAGQSPRPSARVKGGEVVRIELPPPEPTGAIAQDLPLAVLHEDPDVVVLDKAAGMVVHPARGSPHSTVVNALLHRLAGGATLPRLGLVHRLDKDTSGCLVVARTEAALASLQAQWKARTVEKVYLALCHGVPAAEGRLDTPYGRHPRERTRFTSVFPGALAPAPPTLTPRQARGKGRRGPTPAASLGGAAAPTRRAVTGWRVLEQFGDRAALLEVRLETGRTHQIRVHLAEAGHPLLADAVYGGTRLEARLAPGDPVRQAAGAAGRQALHAARLAFDHPRTGRRLSLEAPLPDDLAGALVLLRAAAGTPAASTGSRDVKGRSRGRAGQPPRPTRTR